jgi:hypothetical protein
MGTLEPEITWEIILQSGTGRLPPLTERHYILTRNGYNTKGYKIVVFFVELNTLHYI